jgi:peptidoglycan/LPS O-acetylase OafA/YrhL
MDIQFAANPTRASPQNFNNAVHALRAVATMMVFCAHMFDSFNTYFFTNCGPLNLAMPFIKRFGTFGVELFFVISGYVIMNSVGRYDLRGFFLRRLIRIYPVFAFFTIMFFVLNWLSHLFPAKTSIADLLLNLAFVDIYFGTPALSPNAWSLTYEANFYALAGIGCFFLRKRLLIACALLALVAFAFLAAFPISAYFAIGCLLYFARDLQPDSVPRSLQIAVVIAWCALAASVNHEAETLELRSLAMNALLLALTAVFFFIASVRSGVFARLATLKWVFFVGTISYSFYLTHPFSYYPLRVLFQRLGLSTWNIGAAAAVYFPTMLTVALIASYAVYRLLEVAPYRAAFGETVFKKRSAAERLVSEAPPPNQVIRPMPQARAAATKSY